jgi:hypothetical protein
LAKLTKRADQGKIDLVYFDGSGFNLWAKVVYARQKRGERITVAVTKGKSQNVLGKYAGIAAKSLHPLSLKVRLIQMWSLPVLT